MKPENIFRFQDAYVPFCIFVLIAISSLLRFFLGIYEPTALHFGTDDFGHILLSGYQHRRGAINSDLGAVFFGSYSDAHPPLRNLIANILMRSFDSIYYVRFVAIIPAILLVIPAYFLGRTITVSPSITVQRVIGLLCAFLLSVMFFAVIISLETRGYMLMLLFQMTALVSLFMFIKKPDERLLLLYFACAALALYTEYSVMIPFAVYTALLMLVSLSSTITKRTKLIVFAGALGLLAIVVSNFWNMYNFNSFNRFTGEDGLSYAKYLTSITELPIRFVGFFDIFHGGFRNVDTYFAISVGLSLFYMAGVGMLIFQRSYIYLAVATVPFVIAIALAYLELFPFSGTRHCFYLVPSVLVAWIAAGAGMAQMNKSRSYAIVVVLVFILAIAYTQNLFNSPMKYYSRLSPGWKFAVSLFTGGELEALIEDVNESQSDNSNLTVVSPALMERLEIYGKFQTLSKNIKCDDSSVCTVKINKLKTKRLCVTKKFKDIKQECDHKVAKESYSNIRFWALKGEWTPNPRSIQRNRFELDKMWETRVLKVIYFNNNKWKQN
jgi:hypothetical protein